MKVTPVQYIFAYDIPGKLCYFGFPLAVLAWSFARSGIRFENLADLSLLGLGLFICIVSIPLGLLFAGLFICYFLSPYYRQMEKVNGGPFREGDQVYIIVGRHRGEIRTVYSDWQGLSVRLDVGENEKKTFKDVYFSLRLIKIT